MNWFESTEWNCNWHFRLSAPGRLKWRMLKHHWQNLEIRHWPAGFHFCWLHWKICPKLFCLATWSSVINQGRVDVSPVTVRNIFLSSNLFFFLISVSEEMLKICWCTLQIHAEAAQWWATVQTSVYWEVCPSAYGPLTGLYLAESVPLQHCVLPSEPKLLLLNILVLCKRTVIHHWTYCSHTHF